MLDVTHQIERARHQQRVFRAGHGPGQLPGVLQAGPAANRAASGPAVADDVPGRRRAFGIGPGQDHLSGQGAQTGEHAGDVLVPQRAVDEEDLPRGQEGPNVAGDGLGCRRVVGAVQNHPGPGGKHLQPARPAGSGDPLRDGFGTQGKAGAVQHLQGPDRGQSVSDLVASGKGNPQLQPGSQHRVEVEIGAVQPVADPPAFLVLKGRNPAGPGSPALLPNDLQRPLLLVAADHGKLSLLSRSGRTAGLDDAGLLPGDGVQAGSQAGLVIVADGRDHRDDGIDQVGGVQASPQADLQDGDIDIFFREVEKGHGRHYLEVGGVVLQLQAAAFAGGPGQQLLHRLLDGARQASQFFRENLPAVDADTFLDADQVGGGVETGPVSLGSQHRLAEGGHRALAVGAGNKHRGKAVLRIAQEAQQAPDILQPQLGGGHFVAKGIEIGFRLEVIHSRKLGAGRRRVRAPGQRRLLCRATRREARAGEDRRAN